MLRKCVGAIVVGLLTLATLQSTAFAQRGQDEGKGPRAENRGERREKRAEKREQRRERRQEFVENLPEAKREAVEILLKSLRSEKESVRKTAARQLEGLTGQDFGTDAAAWDGWWGANRERFS